MKNRFLMIVVLSVVTIVATAQTYKPATQPTMQSQQVMRTGNAYNGTVYQPFSSTTPSQQNAPSPAKVGGPRRTESYPGWHQNENGEWVPDNAGEYEHGAETGQSDQSPIGDAVLPLLFLSLAFCGVIYLRRKKALSR